MARPPVIQHWTFTLQHSTFAFDFLRHHRRNTPHPQQVTRPVQRTIRILRVALPLVFIAFIAVIAVNWRRGKPHKDKAGNQPVTSTMRPNDNPAMTSITFEDTQTVNGRIASRIRAERVVAFQSGWNTLENVQMTIYRPTGLTYELVC